MRKHLKIVQKCRHDRFDGFRSLELKIFGKSIQIFGQMTLAINPESKIYKYLYWNRLALPVKKIAM